MKKLYLGLFFILFYFGFQPIQAQNYVEFNVTYNDTCGPVNVTFNNTSYLPDTVGQGHFEWYINDKIYSNDFNPLDTILPSGNYNISLWVWDDYGFSSDYNQDIYIKGFGTINMVPEEV